MRNVYFAVPPNLVLLDVAGPAEAFRMAARLVPESYRLHFIAAARTVDVACTSPRNLTRLFAEHARCSPLDYVQLTRFALAKELVMQSSLDLERVAAKAGFSSAQQLRRVWSRWESRPPSRVRSTLVQ